MNCDIANMGNTDQVPVYLKVHRKATWSRRVDHAQQTFGMEGKMNNLSLTDPLFTKLEIERYILHYYFLKILLR